MAGCWFLCTLTGIDLGETVDCLQSTSNDRFVADAITVETEDRSVWLTNEIIGELRLSHDMEPWQPRVLPQPAGCELLVVR